MSLKIRSHTTLGWIVYDADCYSVQHRCAGLPVEPIFASAWIDHCHAWIARQRNGAPQGKLVVGRDPGAGWCVTDAAGTFYTQAKTKALARDCARIIRINPAPLPEGWGSGNAQAA